LKQGEPSANNGGSVLSGGHEALELLEPVLDEDHFGDKRGIPLIIDK
jgi:hypothetical protein